MCVQYCVYPIQPEDTSTEEDEAEPEEPMKKVIRQHRTEREDFHEKDDTPLMQSSKCLKARKEATGQEMR